MDHTIPSYAVGFDLVDVARFTRWSSYPDRLLARIFTPEEVAYARAHPSSTAQHLAVRFAAKEALYKALCGLGMMYPFLQVARSCNLVRTHAGVRIQSPHIPSHTQCIVSVSHTHTCAGATILLVQHGR